MEAASAFSIFFLIQIIMVCVFAGVSLAVLGFWIWMLVDCLQHESPENNEKLTWMLVIVLANWVGALIYFFVRRRERVMQVPNLS